MVSSLPVCILRVQKTPVKSGTVSNAGASAASSSSTSAATHPTVKQEPTTPKDKPTQPDVRPGSGCKCLLMLSALQCICTFCVILVRRFGLVGSVVYVIG